MAAMADQHLLTDCPSRNVCARQHNLKYQNQNENWLFFECFEFDMNIKLDTKNKGQNLFY